MKRFKVWIVPALIMAAALSASSCNNFLLNMNKKKYHAVTGVTLDKTDLVMVVSGTATLHPAVSPANADNKTVTWTSSAEGVATVSNGTVTAVAPGTAAITVTTADGGKTAACAVTVKAITDIQSITLGVSAPTKTDYYNSLSGVAELDLAGISVMAYYGDVSGDITGLITAAPATYLTVTAGGDFTSIGQKTITITVNGRTAAFNVWVRRIRINASIKTNFGISAAGTPGVTDTFNAVHTYLQSRTAAQLASDALIQLGDWIDLPSITVAGTPVTDQAITPVTPPFDGYDGRLLRLIVVGINSFNASGSYAGQGGGANGGNNGAHLVFQFQNIAFTRQMNTTNTNANGYLGSAMRSYLVGDFLTGLTNAGVPDSALWAPARYVANKGGGPDGTHTISDKLWLPTEREMYGANTYSSPTYETAANQARLEYYSSNTLRSKHSSSNMGNSYWQASPYAASSAYFTQIAGHGGLTYTGNASGVSGCAPAFCVK